MREIITTTDVLNDYILGEIGTGTRWQNIRQKFRIDVNRCCHHVKHPASDSQNSEYMLIERFCLQISNTTKCVKPVRRSVNERIEYKLLSFAIVVTTAQPSYLHNLISLQAPRSTRCSSVVTLSDPPTISLKITDHSSKIISD